MNRKWPLFVIGLLVLAVVVPGLFWWGTWFGVRLGDAQLEEFLAEGSKPRHVQHAVEEITRRLEEGRPGMDPWTERLVEVSRRDDVTVRITCAWGMQYDAGRPEFVERLREMVRADPNELVRRNAATSLAAAGDASGLDVLRRMLEPYSVLAPSDGRLRSVPALGRFVHEREVVATLEVEAGPVADVLAPLPGKVARVARENGAEVAYGDELVVLAASAGQVRNAVLALLEVGTAADLEALALVASERSGFEPGIRRSAEAAISAIEGRSGK